MFTMYFCVLIITYFLLLMNYFEVFKNFSYSFFWKSGKGAIQDLIPSFTALWLETVYMISTLRWLSAYGINFLELIYFWIYFLVKVVIQISVNVVFLMYWFENYA